MIEVMSTEVSKPATGLTAGWWVLVVRGIAAVLFGALALAAPRIDVPILILLFGVYALIDAGANLLLAAWGTGAGRRSGWLFLAGLVGIAAGVLALVWPDLTAKYLLRAIAAWAVATGVAEIAAAIELRREITTEWVLAGSGLLSVVFGVLLLLFPGDGALALVSATGAYAIVVGAVLVGLGWRLHRWKEAGGQPIAAAATGAATTAAATRA